MTSSDKIKALQLKAGIEADGVASSKTWLNIYYLLFNCLPYDININSLIKAIQQKIDVRADGYPWSKTWDVLYDLLIDNEPAIDEDTASINLYNESILQTMTKEVTPFAKELIKLATAKGIQIRLMNCLCEDDDQKKASDYNFGLTFGIGIFEKTATGEYAYKDDSPFYTELALIGESIGLTWAGDRKTFTSQPHFHLRPAWAATMKESDMLKELSRRKAANINLLAIL
ncbi:hypothetical protein [Pedobacter sp. UC225_65]|uniref:hypothetical protein n=1 Tax=Pedobacter sp. UC225_65 TaxID=3350173 RepID=UPI003672BDB2